MNARKVVTMIVLVICACIALSAMPAEAREVRVKSGDRIYTLWRQDVNSGKCRLRFPQYWQESARLNGGSMTALNNLSVKQKLVLPDCSQESAPVLQARVIQPENVPIANQPRGLQATASPAPHQQDQRITTEPAPPMNSILPTMKVSAPNNGGVEEIAKLQQDMKELTELYNALRVKNTQLRQEGALWQSKHADVARAYNALLEQRQARSGTR